MNRQRIRMPLEPHGVRHGADYSGNLLNDREAGGVHCVVSRSEESQLAHADDQAPLVELDSNFAVGYFLLQKLADAGQRLFEILARDGRTLLLGTRRGRYIR